MRKAIVEFMAQGSARAVSSAIEACAAERRVVSALVVPWESDATTLRMAVTSTKSDGWAVEHTNLGTITVADIGGDRARVAVVAVELDQPDADRPDQPARSRPADPLTAFARQIEQKLKTAPVAAEPRR